MNKYSLMKITAALGLLLFLAAGCGENNQPDQDISDSGTVVFQENEPVSGWLEIALPGAPLAMDGSGDMVWIMTDTGLAMCWNSETERWSSFGAPEGFDIAASDQGVAILTPGELTVIEGEEMAILQLDGSGTPISVCGTGSGSAVLFQNGSVVLVSEGVITETVESAGRTAVGPLLHENGILAWMNSDGTASVFDTSESLLTELTLPDGAKGIALSCGLLLSSDGTATTAYRGEDTWEDYCNGTVSEGGLICTPEGILENPEGALITSGLSAGSEKVIRLSNGTLWSLAESGVAVWGEIGSVETRLPEADVQRLSCRIAGQTGEGSGSGEGVGSAGASMGGVFRIYESVSSRPDPFTEFPAASRDLRRPIDQLTIEELHLVGITIDPSGGDQAMVEDANGVAYVLREGTILRNNTRIAEITGNEVIVVQQVTVGSEDDIGGTTSIPTIFSMRLHEEGGL